MEVMGFRGRGEHIASHIQLWLKMGANSLLGPLPCSENESFISYIIGKTVVAQTSTDPVYLSLVCERKVERQDNTDSGKPITVCSSRSPLSRNLVLR